MVLPAFGLSGKTGGRTSRFFLQCCYITVDNCYILLYTVFEQRGKTTAEGLSFRCNAHVPALQKGNQHADNNKQFVHDTCI